MVNTLVVLFVLMSQAAPVVMAGAVGKASPAKQANAALENGRKLAKAKKYDEAIAMAEKCLTLDPKKAECHRLAGSSYSSLKQEDKAAPHYREFLKLAPKHKSAPSVRASLDAYEREKNPGAARLKDEAQLAFEDGRQLYKAGQYDAAIVMVEKCLSLVPEMANCHKLAGAIYAVKGQSEIAAHYYREFVRIDPDNEAAPKVRRILEDYDRRGVQ